MPTDGYYQIDDTLHYRGIHASIANDREAAIANAARQAARAEREGEIERVWGDETHGRLTLAVSILDDVLANIDGEETAVVEDFYGDLERVSQLLNGISYTDLAAATPEGEKP